MISKKARTEIAAIINSLMVATSVRREADLNDESKHEWLLRECKLEVELAEKFGIEVPTLNISRAILNEEPMKNRAA